MTNTNTKSNIKFVRNKKYGTITVAQNGWTKEVCNVTWNDKSPKLDIREWDPEYNKMSKGITFSKEEAKKLLRIIASIDFEDFEGDDKNIAKEESILSINQNKEPLCENNQENIKAVNNEITDNFENENMNLE